VIPIRDTVPSRTAPVVTWSIIAANVLIFLYELELPPDELERLLYLFGVVPARFAHPAWAQRVGFPIDAYWPFVTSMFLHGGWGHLVGNMWTLWIFGDNVEDRMGRWRFLVFYLVTGLVAGVTHYVVNPDSMLPTVGASGAIAGVLGAYLLLFPHSRVVAMLPVLFWPVFFEVPAITFLLFWFLSQVFGSALGALLPEDVGGVAWWAHIGGFAAGLLLHRLFLLPVGLAPRPFARDELGIEGAWTK
jgi:membrane associated rhomboid family serine protease